VPPITTATVDESQRTAAKVVGSAYLLAMATAVFAEMYVRARLFVPDDVAQTARNIMGNERLFRLGIAAGVVTCLLDAALVTGLYLVLRPVNHNLALFAAVLRVIETAVAATGAVASFDVLRVLSGADYLQVFDADQLQVLARLSIGTHFPRMNVVFVFLGLGSAVFSYLWWKSSYIPRALALLGLCASLLLAACPFTFIVFPQLTKVLAPAYMAPMGVYEVGLGLWLLIKGLRPYRVR
jgi:hypothetical protein